MTLELCIIAVFCFVEDEVNPDFIWFLKNALKSINLSV